MRWFLKLPVPSNERSIFGGRRISVATVAMFSAHDRLILHSFSIHEEETEESARRDVLGGPLTFTLATRVNNANAHGRCVVAVMADAHHGRLVPPPISRLDQCHWPGVEAFSFVKIPVCARHPLLLQPRWRHDLDVVEPQSLELRVRLEDRLFGGPSAPAGQQLARSIQQKEESRDETNLPAINVAVL